MIELWLDCRWLPHTWPGCRWDTPQGFQRHSQTCPASHWKPALSSALIISDHHWSALVVKFEMATICTDSIQHLKESRMCSCRRPCSSGTTVGCCHHKSQYPGSLFSTGFKGYQINAEPSNIPPTPFSIRFDRTWWSLSELSVRPENRHDLGHFSLQKGHPWRA